MKVWGLFLLAAASCVSNELEPVVDAGAGDVGAVDASGTVAGPASGLEMWPSSIAPGFEIGFLSVHVDPLDGDSPLLALAVMRHPAKPDSRRGVVFFDRGGPRESLSAFPGLVKDMPARLREQFDIVTFDRRGTGASAPDLAVCADLERALRSGRVVRSEGQLTRSVEEVSDSFRACDAATAGAVSAIGSARVARDIDTFRAALGEESLFVYGASYGTRVAVDYATLFPERTAGLVLDGVVELTDTFHELEDASFRAAPGKQQTIPPEVLRSLSRLVSGTKAIREACDADPKCPAGPDSGARAKRLKKRAEDGELPGFDGFEVGRLENAAVDRGPSAQRAWFAAIAHDDEQGIVSALTAYRTAWAPPPADEAKKERPGEELLLKLVHCIDGSDNPPARDELFALLQERPKRALHVSACSLLDLDVERAGFSIVSPPNVSALVFTPANDLRTPAAHARIAAAALGAPLVTWDGVGHCAALKTRCTRQHLEAFIVDGVTPEGDVTCAAR